MMLAFIPNFFRDIPWVQNLKFTSLEMSVEAMMVLKAKLLSVKSVLTHGFNLSRGVSPVCVMKVLTNVMFRFDLYANGRDSKVSGKKEHVWSDVTNVTGSFLVI